MDNLSEFFGDKFFNAWSSWGRKSPLSLFKFFQIEEDIHPKHSTRQT
jgi:hypothetical protein